MKLVFSWKSSHTSLQVRLAIADGRDIMILDGQSFPERVGNGDKLDINEACVAYGSDSHWLIRVFVDDCDKGLMRGLSVAVLYDDTVEPEKKESICDDEDVSPNQADDFPKDLKIPPRRAA